MNVTNNSALKRISRAIINPFLLIPYLGKKGLVNWIPDKMYLKWAYYSSFHKHLDLKNPKSFNEKIQWLKLNDRKPEYTKLADKYAVRDYVQEKIGKKYLIPLLGLYDNVEDINWDTLPTEFVLKCTHGSGTNIICSDKSMLDIKKSKRNLSRWMNKSWFWFGREWCYKDIQPRVICEEFMVDESGKELKDYKIFCFNGHPKLIQVDFDRFSNHKRNIYSIDWEFKDVRIKYPNSSEVVIKKPDKLNEMLDCAKKLSEGISHVRVDFYSINDSIYFGEMTFYHGSGFEKFYPDDLENEVGKWIQLNFDNK